MGALGAAAFTSHAEPRRRGDGARQRKDDVHPLAIGHLRSVMPRSGHALMGFSVIGCWLISENGLVWKNGRQKL
jgi:hypothetical protein